MTPQCLDLFEKVDTNVGECYILPMNHAGKPFIDAVVPIMFCIHAYLPIPITGNDRQSQSSCLSS